MTGLGPSSEEGVGLMSPRLQFGELQRPAEYSGRPVVLALPSAASRRAMARTAASGGPRSVTALERPEQPRCPVLRMSTLFLRTLREDPVDAEVASHRLLVRGGYIRRAAPGGFTWLPLGWIVYRNIERVVREEMDREGFQEVHFPALLPATPLKYQRKRWLLVSVPLRPKRLCGDLWLLLPPIFMGAQVVRTL